MSGRRRHRHRGGASHPPQQPPGPSAPPSPASAAPAAAATAKATSASGAAAAATPTAELSRTLAVFLHLPPTTPLADLLAALPAAALLPPDVTHALARVAHALPLPLDVRVPAAVHLTLPSPHSPIRSLVAVRADTTADLPDDWLVAAARLFPVDPACVLAILAAQPSPLPVPAARAFLDSVHELSPAYAVYCPPGQLAEVLAALPAAATAKLDFLDTALAPPADIGQASAAAALAWVRVRMIIAAAFPASFRKALQLVDTVAVRMFDPSLVVTADPLLKAILGLDTVTEEMLVRMVSFLARQLVPVPPGPARVLQIVDMLGSLFSRRRATITASVLNIVFGATATGSKTPETTAAPPPSKRFPYSVLRCYAHSAVQTAVISLYAALLDAPDPKAPDLVARRASAAIAAEIRNELHARPRHLSERCLVVTDLAIFLRVVRKRPALSSTLLTTLACSPATLEAISDEPALYLSYIRALLVAAKCLPPADADALDGVCASHPWEYGLTPGQPEALQLASLDLIALAPSFADRHFLVLLGAAADVCPSVRLSAGVLLADKVLHYHHLQPTALSTSTLDALIEVALRRASDTHRGVRGAFVRLLASLDPLRFPVAGQRLPAHAAGSWETVLMMLDRGDFRPQHFQAIATYLIGKGGTPHQPPSFSSLMRTCNGQDIDRFVLDQIDAHSSIQHFWASWQFARHIVLSKLRTPLGNPVQTFEALEQILMSLSLGNRPANDDRRQGNFLVAPRMALMAIEHLEKNISVALHGSSAIPGFPKPIVQFFRTNRKSCEDWFTRHRPPMMGVSLGCDSPINAVRFGFQRILEMHRRVSPAHGQQPPKDPRRFKRDVELTIMRVAGALADLRDADAIQGLLAWSRKHIDPLPGLGEGAVERHLGLSSLALQAQGRYEAASQLLAHKLFAPSARESLARLDPSTVQLSIDQLTRCYLNVSDWDGLDAFADTIGDLDGQFAIPDRAYLGALANYDRHLYDAAHDAVTQIKFEGVHSADDTVCAEGFRRPSVALRSSEKYLIAALLEDDSQERVRILEQASKMLEGVLQVAHLESPESLYPYVAQLHCVRALLRGKPIVIDPLTAPICQDAAIWSRVLRVSQALGDTDAISLQIHQFAQVARQHGNLALATRLLDMDGIKGSPEEALESAMVLHSKGFFVRAANRVWTLVAVHMQLDSVLAIIKSALRDGTAAASCISLDRFSLQSLEPVLDPACANAPPAAAIRTRALMLLAQWFRSEAYQANARDLVAAILDLGGEQVPPDQLESNPGVASALHLLSGSCLEQALFQDPCHPNVWARYASWSYRQGHRLVDFSEADDAQDRWGIGRVVADDSTAAVEQIASAFAAAHDRTAATLLDWATDDERQAQLQGIREDLERRLQGAIKSAATIKTLVVLWETNRRRALEFYRVAARGYFEFLKVSQSRQSSDDPVTATLRTFRLMVKCGRDIASVLTAGLQDTPTAPWRDVIPQLLSRFGHSNDFVRRQVAGLISRIAKDSPQDVVYSLCAQTSAMASGQLKEIKDRLRQEHPLMFAEVSAMVAELSRVAVLWEERWVTTLHQLQAAVQSRATRVRNECERVLAMPSLSGPDKQRMQLEKYRTVMSPLCAALEALQDETIRRKPETPRERWFLRRFGPQIRSVMLAFQSPPMPSDVDASAQLLRDLQRRILHATRQPELSLSEISPYLASLESKAVRNIPLPLSGSERTIRGFALTTTVLHTKTRPKRLEVIDSCGERQPFLLKGREDLHLDERIVQFIKVVNQLLARAHQQDPTIGGPRPLAARRYDVVPIGPQSGLIQWVQGAVPVFSLYQAYADREKELAAPGDDGADGSTGDAATGADVLGVAPVSGATRGQPARPARTPAPVRPSEIYYQRLIPALKAHGIVNAASRQDWPVEVLKKVLVELMQATPRTLVSRELWCACSNTRDWWSKVSNYARSAATSSMIGYILGLGDRHLDNILLDLASGELVHIDFNVCFDNGRRLRVPERVPFRLTPNLRCALGPTEEEGAYRLGCEKVLNVMRRSKETLLTLLEAFVYDPLVDWTSGRADDERRKRMEVNVTLRLFASRVLEMQASFGEGGRKAVAQWSELVGRLQPVGELLEQRARAAAAAAEAESLLASKDQELAAEMERTQAAMTAMEDLGRKRLQANTKAVQIADARRFMHETLTKWTQWQAAAQKAVFMIRGDRCQQLVGELGSVMMELPNVVVRDESLQGELRQRFSHIQALAEGTLSGSMSILQTLGHYKAVLQQLPDEYVETTRVQHYRTLLGMMLDSLVPTDAQMRELQDAVDAFVGGERMALRAQQLARHEREMVELGRADDIAYQQFLWIHEHELLWHYERVGEAMPQSAILMARKRMLAELSGQAQAVVNSKAALGKAVAAVMALQGALAQHPDAQIVVEAVAVMFAQFQRLNEPSTSALELGQSILALEGLRTLGLSDGLGDEVSKGWRLFQTMSEQRILLQQLQEAEELARGTRSHLVELGSTVEMLRGQVLELSQRAASLQDACRQRISSILMRGPLPRAAILSDLHQMSGLLGPIEAIVKTTQSREFSRAVHGRIRDIHETLARYCQETSDALGALDAGREELLQIQRLQDAASDRQLIDEELTSLGSVLEKPDELGESHGDGGHGAQGGRGGSRAGRHGGPDDDDADVADDDEDDEEDDEAEDDEEDEDDDGAVADVLDAPPDAGDARSGSSARNTYAIGVLRRVKRKLEGRDRSPELRQSIPEQVDWLIEEATSLDNLCVMFEGFASWI